MALGSQRNLRFAGQCVPSRRSYPISWGAQAERWDRGSARPLVPSTLPVLRGCWWEKPRGPSAGLPWVATGTWRGLETSSWADVVTKRSVKLKRLFQ